jgi:hypothetical protein
VLTFRFFFAPQYSSSLLAINFLLNMSKVSKTSSTTPSWSSADVQAEVSAIGPVLEPESMVRLHRSHLQAVHLAGMCHACQRVRSTTGAFCVLSPHRIHFLCA